METFAYFKWFAVFKKLSEAMLLVDINSIVRAHQSTKFTRGTFFTITVYKLCSMIAKMIYLNRHFYKSVRTCINAKLTTFTSIFLNCNFSHKIYIKVF